MAPVRKTRRESVVTKKLTVQLNEKLSSVLEQISEEEEIPQTQVLRQAIALYKFVEDEKRAGNKLAIANADNEIIKEIIA
jgi:predicted transcriptional regulator